MSIQTSRGAAAFICSNAIRTKNNDDGRTYHGTKIQVSANSTTWTTVFDSATHGKYAETLAGKTHTFTEQNVRYVRDYLNGSTANTGHHWVEIEVRGRRDKVYVGDYFEWHGSA